LCHGWAFVFLGAHKLKKSHPAIGLRLAPEVDPALSLPKPFKDYRELVSRLKSKGMTIRDEDRAVRKLSQIGYYRLSGYWHVCRIPIVDSIGENVINKITNVPERKDEFFRGTSFDNIVTLYLFDKKLRLLLLDAIERVEIYIRTIIAHELGKIDSLAYKKEKFIAPKHLKNYERDGQTKNNWQIWHEKSNNVIDKSRDACIAWHKSSYTAIPFWVVIEAWDFGLMSNYYNILGDRSKDRICQKIGVPNKKTLNNWLQEINTLRNKCAHHSRLWNMRLNNPLLLKGLEKDSYFNNCAVRDMYTRRRIYGIICVLWFLVKRIGPSSGWISVVADHIDSLPVCAGVQFSAMGFPDEKGFPRVKFDMPPK
jgi:abortive infection bacteriophage resistance protein